MRIVHLLAPADAGGLERVVHALAIGQQRRGHAVIAVPVVEEWTAEHTFAAPLTRANVEVRPLTVPARGYLRERRELRRLLRSLAPDVVHSHGYHTDVVCGDVARRSGAATVSTAHGFTRGSWRNRLYERFDRAALRHFHAVAAVSRPLASELRHAGVSADRLHVVPNAWSSIATPLDRASARRELGLDRDVFVAGWVGRMSREKGLDTALDALSLLGDVPMTLCVLGAGEERAREEARASSEGLGHRVHWAGLIPEAERYFLAFDVLVLSSRTEGVPMVVLEAMAAGVPVVATAVGGLPDVVTAREALLVPAEEPAALAAAIREVFVGRAAATDRARHARVRLDHEFAEEPWLRHYDDVYDAALAVARVRPRADSGSILLKDAPLSAHVDSTRTSD